MAETVPLGGIWVWRSPFTHLGIWGYSGSTINGQGNPDKNDLIEAGLKAGLDKNDCKRIYNETEEAVSEFTSFLAKRFKIGE